LKRFKDLRGDEWDVAVTVAGIKRVREHLKVDLLGVLDGELLGELLKDPILLVDIIYVLCEDQAQKRSISDEDFGRAMAGDPIEAATQALLDEIVAFCPSPRDRASLGRVLQATNRAMDQARNRMEEKLTDEQLDQLFEKHLSPAGDSSGSAPESSESTPVP
jgi:hypothetical protein